MHEQAQLRLKKEEVTKLGAAVFVIQTQDLFRTKVFKEENRLLTSFENPFRYEKQLVFSTALADPAGHASAIYGVSRKCPAWGQWLEKKPCWFVIDRQGILTYAATPSFATPTSYIKEVDDMLAALTEAAK
ncbi:MAG: peroxiredoxin [Planctomycetaceae bacterium]|jgi:peroxiredoxin